MVLGEERDEGTSGVGRREGRQRGGKEASRDRLWPLDVSSLGLPSSRR